MLLHQNAQKGSKNFKPSTHIAVSTGTNLATNVAFYALIGCITVGSQGVVVKYAAASFLRTVDYKVHSYE